MNGYVTIDTEVFPMLIPACRLQRYLHFPDRSEFMGASSMPYSTWLETETLNLFWGAVPLPSLVDFNLSYYS